VIDLRFTVLDARPDLHAAVPTLAFRIRLMATQPVHAILLRCRLQIETRRRSHTPPEQERLTDLFGATTRWKDTLRPLIWTQTTISVGAFEDSVEVGIPVACTYDFEVAAAKYLDALENGDVPLLFLFSGTVFVKHDGGFRVEQIPWDKGASHGMPVGVWRSLMDSYFPGCSWIRLRHETLDLLQRYRASHAFMSWDDAIGALIGPREVNAK
jgi:hypothetical protein